MVSKGRKATREKERKKRRDADSLKRSPASREPRKRIFIACEGQVTEVEYFEDLGRRARQVLEVRAGHDGSAPMSVVSLAVQTKTEGEILAQKENDPLLKWDEVWACFDVDQHPKIPEAKALARQHGVRLAVSNPCFELWALLHFEDQRAELHRQDVSRRLRAHMKDYEKSLHLPLLDAKHDDAVKRAKSLRKEAQEYGNEDRNPTTNVDGLATFLRRPST